jgi:hypothetical protein
VWDGWELLTLKPAQVEQLVAKAPPVEDKVKVAVGCLGGPVAMRS